MLTASTISASSPEFVGCCSAHTSWILQESPAEFESPVHATSGVGNYGVVEERSPALEDLVPPARTSVRITDSSRGALEIAQIDPLATIVVESDPAPPLPFLVSQGASRSKQFVEPHGT